MGHSRMGKLPATRRWNEVVALIGNGADVADVALAASKAAEGSMGAASREPALAHTLWLLTQIPLAARRGDFDRALRDLGLGVGANPDIVEICTTFVAAVEDHVQSAGGRSDAGEMATLSGVEALVAAATPASEDLFPEADGSKRAKKALARLATVKQFGGLARDFVAKLTRRYLDYYLSRELPQHVGINSRFRTMKELREFEAALDLHCREATVIMEAYAGDWFSKTNFETGIDAKNVISLARKSFEKMQSELRIRRGADG